jgi:site-specific DNA-methyltransferase (adenine-specific)/adenine-specific DNA-methyltransferase
MTKNNKKNKDEAMEQYLFEPIKGYPMLNWQGKRPFRSTQYYPAQLKEVHGEPEDGWLNEIYWGDNLQVMSHLLKKYRGKVQLIYIDPPFDSKADYKKKIRLKGESVSNDYNSFEEKQYGDIWTNDEYFQFMYERLILLRELLEDGGSIYLHCDWNKNYVLRMIMDEVFGPDNCLNEIIWYSGSVSGFKSQANKYIRCHDTILLYAKNRNQYVFNKQFLNEFSEATVRRYDKTDKKGRRYKIYFEHGEERKRYLDESEGLPISDVWTDIPSLQTANMGGEYLNYPTQKPRALLERIIQASSNPGDIVLDCFMGAGTTQEVALKFGRKFIGADINLGAIQLTTKRLLNISKELKNDKLKLDTNESQIDTFYKGFSVYNVNYYDFFKNPEEAKELLMEAYEIQPLPRNSVYDGEKDGYMVKIMPVNRIATRKDLNELITNFDYKTFDKRKKDNPTKPVEKVLLICMGHEPDLAAELKKQMHGYDIEVKMGDVLRDKANLEFKRETEARIALKNGRLTIENFYPMNLLQKLSLYKKDVKEWRELVESVMIDWNYDGKLLNPQTVDVPEKNELVKGAYPVPKDVKVIKVKITDLLSESYEDVING